MVILNIETSTHRCSAAITCNGKLLYEQHNNDGNHAHDLPLFIDTLLNLLQTDGLHLDAVALSQGPGSYTGLRIGTATAKGLCYGLNIPLLPIDTLQIVAAAAIRMIPENSLLCPMIDARRMEVYCALYNKQLERLTEIEPKVIDKQSFANELNEHLIYFVGNGSTKCKDVLQHHNAKFIENIEADAQTMGVLAEEAFQQNRIADLAYFDPFYLKEFQATISRKTEFVLGK